MMTRSQLMPSAANQARGAAPERRGGDGLFVVEDLGVDEPGAVIEGGVDVAVAGTGVAVVAVVAAAVEPPAAAVGDGAESSSRRRG